MNVPSTSAHKRTYRKDDLWNLNDHSLLMPGSSDSIRCCLISTHLISTIEGINRNRHTQALTRKAYLYIVMGIVPRSQCLCLPNRR